MGLLSFCGNLILRLFQSVVHDSAKEKTEGFGCHPMALIGLVSETGIGLWSSIFLRIRNSDMVSHCFSVWLILHGYELPEFEE